MHLVDILLILAIALAVGFAVRLMIRARKQGKHLSCGGDCSSCPGCKYHQ